MKKISVVGLDGSGKSTSLDILVKQHIQSATVLDPSATLYDFEAWQVCHVPLGRRIAAFVDRKTLSGEKVNSRLLQGLIYASIMGLGSHPFQWWLAMKYKPEVIVKERDTPIDGAVYTPFYFPASGRLTAEQRVWLISHVLRHKLPEQVVYIDVEPEVALARIHRSLEEKAWTKRKKKPHLHETLDGLTFLRRNYYEVLEAAAAAGTGVTIVNTTHLGPEAAAHDIYRQILPYLKATNGSNGAHYNGNSNSSGRESPFAVAANGGSGNNGTHSGTKNSHRVTKVLVIK